MAKGEADSESDLDLLVDMEPERSLLDLGGLVMELQELLGCRVDSRDGEGTWAKDTKIASFERLSHYEDGRIVIAQKVASWAWPDLNRRPLGYEPSALTGLSYRPKIELGFGAANRARTCDILVSAGLTARHSTN